MYHIEFDVNDSLVCGKLYKKLSYRKLYKLKIELFAADYYSFHACIMKTVYFLHSSRSLFCSLCL